MIGSLAIIRCGYRCHCCRAWCCNCWSQCCVSSFSVWEYIRVSAGSNPAMMKGTPSSRHGWWSTNICCWSTDTRLCGRTAKETGYSGAGALRQSWLSHNWRMHFSHCWTTKHFWRGQRWRTCWHWSHGRLNIGRHYLNNILRDRRRDTRRRRRRRRRNWLLAVNWLLSGVILVLPTYCYTSRSVSSPGVVDWTAVDGSRSNVYRTRRRGVHTSLHTTVVKMYVTVC